MKEVIFRPSSKEAEFTVPQPRPAKYYLPEWYKKVPLFVDNELKIDESGLANTTMKACLPFLDAFTSGYIQETWCDVYVNTNTGEYRYSTTPVIIDHRQAEKQHYPKIQGFDSQEFVWNQVWIPELPDGYSMIYMHPINRFDLPFLSLSGIIDHDRLKMEKIATHPFFVRDGFEGIIPKGTPMFQMIPLKRDIWCSIVKEFDEILLAKSLKIRQYFIGGYKKLFWQKKDYQ